MNKNRLLCLFTSLLAITLAACSQERATQPAAAAETPEAAATAAAPEAPPGPNVVQLQAIGKTFAGPAEIPAGWTTFKFANASDMVHFAMIDVPPAGVTLDDMNGVMIAFQEAMDAMNAGDEEATNAAFGKFPEWVGELGRNGGPGLLSPGRIGQATVYLEPGYYLIECYVKSGGVFHTTPPAGGGYGMVMALTVTESDAETGEPEANVALAVRNTGFEVVSGSFREGFNTVRVNFEEQQALPSFVGNDVHVMAIHAEDSVARAGAWMDWRTPEGLEDPAPVDFLGGLNDQPAGTHGYFSVDLKPGDYALIAEVPDPEAAGFVHRFTVVAE